MQNNFVVANFTSFCYISNNFDSKIAKFYIEKKSNPEIVEFLPPNIELTPFQQKSNKSGKNIY